MNNYKNFSEIENFIDKKIDETERFRFYKYNNKLYYEDENFVSYQISHEKALVIIETQKFAILPPSESLGGVVEIFPFKGIAIEREVSSFDDFLNEAIESMTNFEIEKDKIKTIHEVEKLKIPSSVEEFEALLNSGFYYYYS